MERVRRRLPLEREQDLCLAKEREFVGGGTTTLPLCGCFRAVTAGGVHARPL